MEGLPEEHITKVHLPEERYGRRTNRRTHTNNVPDAFERTYGRMPQKRTYTKSIPDGRTLRGGCHTEERKPKVHLTEERYGRTSNRRTVMEEFLTEKHILTVDLTQERLRKDP